MYCTIEYFQLGASCKVSFEFFQILNLTHLSLRSSGSTVAANRRAERR